MARDAIRSGTRLKHYEIVAPLGKGGMGEVYLARDIRLERRVALKLLPTEFTADADRLRRFEQEARAASALNHPNIITIYEIGRTGGVDFIASEFIEGRTLRQVMLAGRMKLRNALEVAVQVSGALAVAHAAGIVHRDIKPENVMLRPDGLVKILDFGLAKLTGPGPGATDTEALTALTGPATLPATLLGTARYMSPEQARGLEVDGRSDIFSIGVVLYEMVAGQAPFAGATMADVMAAILDKDPVPLVRFRSDVPAELEWIVAKALTKDRDERYQTAREMLSDLKRLASRLEREAERERTGEPVPADRRELKASHGELAPIRLRQLSRMAIPATLVLIALAALAVMIYRTIGTPPTETPAGPLRIVPFTSFPGTEDYPAFSRDGERIAFTWDGEHEDNADIYIKLIGEGAPLRLTTHPAPDVNPVWSPDGRHILFFRQLPDRDVIYMVPSLGGPERKVDEKASQVPWWNVAWSPDGKTLALSDKSSPEEPFSIFLLSLNSGERRRLTLPPPGWLGHGDLGFSPDGTRLAFIAVAGRGVDDLHVVAVAGAEPKRLTFEPIQIWDPVWTADGREIVFAARRGGGAFSLWRIPASGGTPELVHGVGQNALRPTISGSGNRLAYTQSLADTNIWRIEVPGSTGQRNPPTRLIYSTQADSDPEYSPDGSRIAFASTRSGNSEIWVCQSDGSNPIQLTTLGGLTRTPRWSPDGRHIAFESHPAGGSNADVYVVAAEGGRPRRLTTDASEERAPGWSRDARWIYFGSARSGMGQIWKAPAEGGEAVQVTQGGGFEGFESADGRWLYYTRGRYEGEPTGVWRVPAGGGKETLVFDNRKPGLWRFWTVVKEGIYFITAENPSQPMIEFFGFANGNVTHVVGLEKPIPLFGRLNSGLTQFSSGLTVSPDGRWILYTQLDQGGSDIMLVENFR